MTPQTKLTYKTLDNRFFCQMADRLLNECKLVINGSTYRIVEIEFYLKNNCHMDHYVHCDKDQLLLDTFYFHKHKTGTYKSGTFKGMDLTFGDASANAYFGILIRSIYDVSNDLIIEGPCNVVNRILTEYALENIDSLTNRQNLNIYSNQQNFVLQITNDFEPERIYSGPRIGLSAKYPEFKDKAYRFVIFKDRIKKGKKQLVLEENN